jgi:hypothetical protein
MLWEKSFLEFFIITLVLGGGAALAAGRALALGWRPFWKVVWFMALLGFAVRFVHFALAKGTLVAKLIPLVAPLKLPVPPIYYFTDTAVLVLLAALAYRYTRALQMVRQYPWLYKQTGPLSWSKLED